MSEGYLTLVLHAHLPFVRHPEKPGLLEERWLFEAITECYVPLIMAFERLIKDGVHFRITLSLSPPLITMLNDPLLQKRYVQHITNLIRLAESEMVRNSKDPDLLPLAEMYHGYFKKVRHAFTEDYGGNILLPFRSLQALGVLEVITCCATHGYLPLMRTHEARRAQVQVAVELYSEVFGRPPLGIWLPECGYAPGVDVILREFGLRYFFVETHGISYADPSPRYGVYAPVYCQSGVAAFGRDPTSSKQVWDRHTGYPGQSDYREFYRDIGHDLDLDYLAPYLPDGTVRCDTGLKYYRITGLDLDKEPYRPERAAARTAVDAEDFVLNTEAQIDRLSAEMDQPPVVVAPYDAELYGHWWFEGPLWLEHVCRQVHSRQSGLTMVTPSDYLGKKIKNQVVKVAASSWGEGGYNQVWLNPANDWIYRHLHRAETTMVDLADLLPDEDGYRKRVLNQAARELLLAQSSDWAFILKTGTTVEYASQRIDGHVSHFFELVEALTHGKVELDVLKKMEEEDKIFPDLDYRIYSRYYSLSRAGRAVVKKGGSSKKILMLSWEFPPKTVGGLARHVYDLSRALADMGESVYVLTCPVEGTPSYELVQGVHVYRVEQKDLTATDFMRWVGQLNGAMVCLGRTLSQDIAFDLVHAHDWLVGDAGAALQNELGLPLVATIHATEYGRQRGIHNELQQSIHTREGDLAARAQAVIVCSHYMEAEVRKLFGVTQEKLIAIPNGVDPANMGAPRQITPEARKFDHAREKLVLFVGRLVPEKGAQVLLEAFQILLAQNQNIKLIIGGAGTYEFFLKNLACELGVADKVLFPGFLNETRRNRYLKEADVAVFPSLYEPFGIVALEAMASHVPVIVSDTGGMREVVEHGIDGYKVPPGRADHLAYYIMEILKNPGLARELTARAWKKVLTVYDWHAIGLKTLEAYRKAAEAWNG
jgi:1,4-alpha-glucan branching enzyme